jgi:hypothetical protein
MVEDDPYCCVLCGQDMGRFTRASPYMCVMCGNQLPVGEKEQFNRIVASTKPAMAVKWVFFASSMVFVVMAIIDYNNLLYDIISGILFLVAIIINRATWQAVKPKCKAFVMQFVQERYPTVDYVGAFEKEKRDKALEAEKDKRDKALEAEIETVTRVFRKISITRLCEKLHVPMATADEVETILQRMITSGKIQGTMEMDVFTRLIPPTEPSRTH